MPTQRSLRSDWLVRCFLQWQCLTGGSNLGRQRSSHKVLRRMQLLLALEWHPSSWMMLQAVHAHFECTIPCHANLQSWYNSDCDCGDVISYPMYDVIIHELYKSDLLCENLVYKFKDIIKNGWLCVIVTLFLHHISWIRGAVKHYSLQQTEGLKRSFFLARSLLPSIFSTILYFFEITNWIAIWLQPNCWHRMLTNGCPLEKYLYGSNRSAIWLPTTPR